MRFTQFYANGPEGSPTRAALLTGPYQQRVGGLECAIGTGNTGRYDDAIRLREQNELGLPARESSLARGLKEAGYRTAIIGKWHLGYEPKFFPVRMDSTTGLGPSAVRRITFITSSRKGRRHCISTVNPSGARATGRT